MTTSAGWPSNISRKARRSISKGQLQTRKWTDQQGVERYSTEVVLQGFRGELTLLDRAGDRADTTLGNDNGDFGSPGPTAARERQPAMAGAGRRDDMDDEIPF
jgi:single-strand DNA-binding protein